MKGTNHPIVIGKDTRVSGYMIESALVSGICSMGMNAWYTGPLPTPGGGILDSISKSDSRRYDKRFSQSISR